SPKYSSRAKYLHSATIQAKDIFQLKGCSKNIMSSPLKVIPVKEGRVANFISVFRGNDRKEL
ncbi:MAG: hypothetical protein ACM34N_01165, partial [Ignavibacteria bacterium]